MMNVEEHSLDIRSLSISQGERTLIQGLDLCIAAGEIVALMGASGSGKSTLLAWLSGTLDKSFNAAGELWIGEQRIDQRPCEQRQIGLLFQQPLLFPHLSVGENLVFAVPASIKGKARYALAQDALDNASLSDYFNKAPDTLSGGQAARVSLMRTLLAKPRALLLDEPYSRLDQELRVQFREFVEHHCREQKLPTLIVTHDPEDRPEHSRCLHMRNLGAEPSTVEQTC